MRRFDVALLALRDINVAYGSIRALKGISLSVLEGQIVSLIGANGAGKSTTLRAISGLVKVNSGTITFDNKDITNLQPHQVVAIGISHAPEGRMIFSNLTVRENLNMGAYLRGDRREIKQDADFVFGLFPRLSERLNQVGGTLSGGEQQMLAIGRALMARPRLLLLDEPSLGIAPNLMRLIFEKIVEINRELGMAMLLVEQNARQALKIAHYAYVLETGAVALEGSGAELAQNEQVSKAYLGDA